MLRDGDCRRLAGCERLQLIDDTEHLGWSKSHELGIDGIPTYGDCVEIVVGVEDVVEFDLPGSTSADTGKAPLSHTFEPRNTSPPNVAHVRHPRRTTFLLPLPHASNDDVKARVTPLASE